MPRTIVVPQTILRAATTLALAALTASTALAAPSMYSQNSAQEAPTVTGINGIGGENDTQIPDSITKEHWAYQFIAELGEKYGATTKLNEEQPIPKNELVDKFIIALTRITETYDREGGQAISRDDLESARRLIVALEDELFGQPAYRTIRTTIEQLLTLVEPAAPIYKYKAGVNGFLRGEGAGNFRLADMSYVAGRDAGRLLYRVKPFVYWHPNDYLDVHLEGQGYGFTGEGSRDSHEVNLYQGFVEAKLPSGDAHGKNLLALKAGRQEFNYGSGFILGTDTFFNGLTFDALRLRVQPSVNWFNFLTVDLLAGKYAAPFSDGLKGDLLGAYVTYQPAADSSLEAYALRDTGYKDRQPGEHRDTFGFRSTSTVGMFGLDYELAYQSGKIFNGTSNENIAAYGGHVDLTGDFNLKAFENFYKSSVFLSFAMGSGDKNAVDGTSSSKEFRNSNNDSSLMGDMGVIGDLSGFDAGNQHASGLQVYTLGYGIDLSRKLNFSATGRKFMADKVADGFSRDLGIEADFTLTYIHNKDYALIVGYDHFFTGKFFRQATGSDKDINYAFAMLQFNYEWTKRKR